MKIFAVGIGPGDIDYIAPKAKEVIEESDVIIGYTTYIKIIEHLITDKEIISTGMKNEIERCRKAFEEVLKGKNVSVISSGDSGIYGMASLLYEMAQEYKNIEIEVIPGITAANATASILGSPLSNDFVVISLSDLLTPWDTIEKRLNAVGLGDFVACLYNPQSKKRNHYIEKACNILLKHKPADTPCGYVKNSLRGNSNDYDLCTLEELKNKEIDMFTTVIIGNSTTKIINNKLITSRGYVL